MLYKSKYSFFTTKETTKKYKSKSTLVKQKYLVWPKKKKNQATKINEVTLSSNICHYYIKNGNIMLTIHRKAKIKNVQV